MKAGQAVQSSMRRPGMGAKSRVLRVRSVAPAANAMAATFSTCTTGLKPHAASTKPTYVG